MENTVIIMRGQSGAGKSTFIKTNYREAYVVSADHYFVNSNLGTYSFDPKKLNEAHAECFKKFLAKVSAVPQSVEPQLVVVDNTNTTAVECAPYVSAALAFGWKVKIVTLVVDPRVAFERNVHGVSEETVRKQHDRLVKETKNFPKHWDVTHISVEAES